MVAIDASALVCYITRFTEENFATLIAFIFIYKVSLFANFLENLLHFYQNKFHFQFKKAIENLWSIGVNFPIEPSDSIYDCVCTSPYNKNDLGWAKYSKPECLVCIMFFILFHTHNSVSNAIGFSCLLNRVSTVH